MRHQLRPAMALVLLAVWGSCGMLASGQTPVATTTEEVAPISPEKSPGPMSLDACIDLGMQHQPSLDAARASLSAAHSGQRAVQRMIIPRLFTPDLSVRRQQACLGVTIASAALTQAEWDTRYAITRNFFTVQYVREQGKVVDEVLKSLIKSRERAQELFDRGDVKIKITKIDLRAIDIQLGLVKTKKSQIDNGMLKAMAALREGMGLGHDYPLEIAAWELPPAVTAIKIPAKTVKDDKGKEKKIEESYRYDPVYSFNKTELITAAIANRGEMVQASAANRVTELEIQAQTRIRGWQGRTFAMGGDIHAQPIPPGIFNNEYRPGAIGPEMPPMVAGRKADRVQRVTELYQRSIAVVDKTTNLVSLDVEAQFLKWQEALEQIQHLRSIENLAKDLPDQVAALTPDQLTGDAIIRANTTAIMVRASLNEEMHIHALALAGLERATAGAFRVYPVPSMKK